MNSVERWTNIGPVVAVFTCLKCGRQDCGQVRRDARGRLFVRNERDLPLPRRVGGDRRPAGVDGTIVILDSAWRAAQPWCAKCRRPISIPADAPSRLNDESPIPVRIPCQ